VPGPVHAVAINNSPMATTQRLDVPSITSCYADPESDEGPDSESGGLHAMFCHLEANGTLRSAANMYTRSAECLSAKSGVTSSPGRIGR